MTETRTCEFDHNNNPKKNTRSTEELKDGFSGLPYSEVEDGLSRLPCFGVEDDKGEILEDEFSGLPCSGVEDGLCGLPCFGVEDDKGGILEDGFAEKGKKKRRICEMGRLNDPLVVLGSDIMLMILSCLDARSVALCLLVSCGWRGIASSDKIWSSKLCKWLFHRASAKLKTVCLVLSPAAPEYWRMLDPYWNGTGRPLRRYFLPDGSQTAEPDDKIWGGHESCYSIVTSVLADGKIRAHYVRINRLPPMYVTRKEDWSWEISNNFCTYRSIPDADKKDGTGPLFLLH